MSNGFLVDGDMRPANLANQTVGNDVALSNRFRVASQTSEKLLSPVSPRVVFGVPSRNNILHPKSVNKRGWVDFVKTYDLTKHNVTIL